MNNLNWSKNLKTPIAIIGLGKSGRSAYNFLLNLGYSKENLVTYDQTDSNAQFNNFNDLVKKNPQTLVVSPGVALSTDWINTLVANGAELTSEISLATSVLTTEKIIGITGSVGKSTVTSILGKGALIMDEHAFVGGNLGTPFCDYALKIISGEKKANWIILELSSYQLENCNNLQLHGSAVTFLSSNHLERYKDLEEYYKTKMKITEITKDFCVFNKSSKDAVVYSQFSKCPAVLTHAIDFFNKELLSEVKLIGSHNKDNFSIAAEVAHLCEWSQQSFIAMAEFKGLSHRLEYVANIKGVQFINDSKATSMDSVIVASTACLENLNTQNILYVLIGGKDKNLPWEELQIFKSNKNIKCVFFGACGIIAKTKSQLEGDYFTMLGNAIEYCQKKSTQGDIILLSPGGTSLDEFKNFEERGDYFKRLVLSGAEA